MGPAEILSHTRVSRGKAVQLVEPGGSEIREIKPRQGRTKRKAPAIGKTLLQMLVQQELNQ